MKVSHVLLVATLGTGLLSGCISAPTGGAHHAYYDGAYGAYYGGFWGRDGHFYYYTDATQRMFVRDDAGHFRMNAERGFQAVKARPREKGYARRYAHQEAREQAANGN